MGQSSQSYRLDTSFSFLMTMPDLLVLKLRMMMIGVILAENCLEIHLNSLLHMGIERSFA
jgi:hypothetical protein